MHDNNIQVDVVSDEVTKSDSVLNDKRVTSVIKFLGKTCILNLSQGQRFG